MVKSVGLLTIQVFIIQVNASNSIATLQPMVSRLLLSIKCVGIEVRNLVSEDISD